MDGLVFCKLMYQLNLELKNSTINRVATSGGSVYFSFYKDKNINFEFRTTPAPPLLSMVDEISGDSHGALSAINGAAVKSIGTFGYERAGYFELEKRKPSGKLLTYFAILEPAGNYANFLLTDGDKTILYSLSTRTIDPDRNIGAGNKYSVPKANKRYSLDNLEGAKKFDELAGFYPVTVKHAEQILGDFPDVCANIKDKLFNDKNFYIDEKNKVIPFFIIGAKKVIEYHELAEYYNKTVGVPDETRIVDSIKKYFSTRLDKYLRLAEKLEQELSSAKNYEQYYEEAALIKANLHKISGVGEYVFEKYTEHGIVEVKYTIKYGDDLTRSADKLFKKATRLKKSIPLIEERLQETLQLAISAEEQLYFASNENIDDFADFERLLNSKNTKINQKKRKKVFHELSFGDCTLFIGKSSYSNHELVFHYAIDSDMWLHARNLPSAHVILRKVGKITDDEIEYAAKVVAAFSKVKNEKKVDVDYTLKKYVTKPKNTPAGFVIYKNFKTINVEPMDQKNVLENVTHRK